MDTTLCEEKGHLFTTTPFCDRCELHEDEDPNEAEASPEAEQGDGIPDEAVSPSASRPSARRTASWGEVGIPLTSTVARPDAELLSAAWTGALIGLASAAAGVALGRILWG